MLHGSSSIGKTVDHRLGCMSRAQSAVYQRMRQLGLHQEVMLMTDMFDMAAKSAGDYGCEIWSTPWLGDGCLHKCDLQKFHCSTLLTLRRCLGVSKGTASLSVLAECGKYPL